MEKRKPLHTVGERNKSLHRLRRFLRKLENRTTTPASSLLCIYAEEMRSGCLRDICISMFIEALFTTAKKWK
jgi:hypothetical protein